LAQVKKAAIREAIIDSAYELFRERGYADTSISDIAAAAGVSKANIYVYFKSKFAILYAVFEPWFRSRIETLEDSVGKISDPREKLRHICFTLWRDIPAEDNGFANNMMQAISMAWKEGGYDRSLLLWSEHKVTEMIKGALPPDRVATVEREFAAHLMFMAFDGFVLNHRIVGPSRRMNGIVDLMVDFLLHGPASPPEPQT
jgi:AcrR family transcriptional regulator